MAALILMPAVLDSAEPTIAADAVGPAHPAVAAISMVVERESALLREQEFFDSQAAEERLRYAGLALKSKGVSARYVGKCQVAGRDCDHLVLFTPEGHVSVFLMAHEHPSSRVLIAV